MSDTENTILTLVSKLPDLWRQRADSLAEYTDITRNDYITLVEEHLTTVDYLPEVLDRLQTLLGCNMLAAISLIVGVPNVDVVGTLDKVATKRDPLGSALGGGAKLASFIGRESVRIGLPSYDDIPLAVGEAVQRSRGPGSGRGNDTFVGNHSKNNSDNTIATDSGNIDNRRQFDNRTTTNSHNTNVMNIDGSNSPVDNRKITEHHYNSNKGNSSAQFGKDNLKALSEASALSTGKQFEVVFERDGNKTPVLMSLRLNVNTIPTEFMRKIIAFSDQTNTFGERRLRAKAGELSYVKDLVFCNDLIEEARKNRFRDKTGFYRQMMDRRSKNWLSGLLSMNWSINNASAIIVCDQNTVDDLTAELGGSIEDFKVRQRVFKDTLTVYLVVMDTRWDRVTIYTRGMDEAMSLSARDFKAGKGGKTGNVDDIIQAYRTGATPAF